MIRFDKVTKTYPRAAGATALRDVSFRIAKGEFAFLTGPSGAGKSTILKLLYMAERPTSGEVRISGYTSTKIKQREVAELRRRLGIVFQDFQLLEDRNAEANVAFALEVIGTPKASIAPKVARALTQVGLASKATALPRAGCIRAGVGKRSIRPHRGRTDWKPRRAGDARHLPTTTRDQRIGHRGADGDARPRARSPHRLSVSRAQPRRARL